MIDLHYFPTGNNLKITIMLEETGLAYTLIKYDMYAGDHFTPQFRKINPNNKLPAIVDRAPTDGGEALTVFESGAILVYLAEKAGMLLSADFRPRMETLQWLTWQVAGLGPMLGQAHHFVRYAPEGQDYGIERYTRESRRLLEVMEYQLERSEYLAGSYSIADIACYPWVSGARMVGIEMAELPAVSAWLDKIKDRPAVTRAVAAIMDEDRAKYTQARATLTPKEWSNLFGDNLLAAAKAR